MTTRRFCIGRCSNGAVLRRVVLLAVGFLLMLNSARVAAQAPAPSSPRATVDWLRVLVLEGRLGLRAGLASGPRLFSETVVDGRTWMEYIADTLAATAGGDPAQPGVPNEWALVDEAVSVLLAEADTMKELAAARTGPEAARFHEARRRYLVGAARLLNGYKVAAGDVFDALGGPLVNAAPLPDWLFPGEIHLDDISGAARLNTRTRDYSGRLSGRLRLPGWGLSLTVPTASFDRDGRMDLSAYGTLTFEGGSLTVPPRQPLRVRRSAEGRFAVAGDVRLALNNGLRFDASMSLADPVYCFGLSARGLEFDLGRELLVRVPVLSPGQLNAFGDEARDAFADYLRGLNGAAETLLSAATNFPAMDETQFGQPPEFVAPEFNLDVSVLNAWSGEIIAKTRVGLSNAQQSLQPVLDSLRRLNDTARSATNSLADERARMLNLAARMEARRRMKTALDLAAATQSISNAADVSQFQAQAVAGAREEGRLINALVTADLPDRLGESMEVARLLINMEGLLAHLAQPPTPEGTIPAEACDACLSPAANFLQRAAALIRCATRHLAVRHGLNPVSGTVTNAAVFNALTEADLYRLGRILADIDAEAQSKGIELEGELSIVLPVLLVRQQTLLLDELERTSSLPRLFELIALITENYNDLVDAGQFVPGDELVAQLEQAAGPRLQGVPPAVMDAARAEAQKTLALRRRALRDDVEILEGRRRHVGLVPPGDHYQPDVLTQLDQFFRILNLPVPPVMGGTMDDLVRFKVAELRARPFTAEFLTNRLADGQNLLSLVIGLTDWADRRLTNEFAVLGDLQFAVTNLSFSLVGAAELQQAWWFIDRYQDAFRMHAMVYGANVQAGLLAAERQSRDAALLASRRIAGAFTNLVATLVTEQDVRVPLPGKVEITRIFGRLCYDRSTGGFGGCFGGRVEFPELGPEVFFEIAQACLNTDGSYSISAASAGPLPFGRMRLTSSLDISGGANGVASFAGSGTLNIDTGGGFAAGPTVGVEIEYDSGRRELLVGAQASQLRLSDDVAVLNGTVQADVGPAAPRGALTIEGRLGLLARTPLPTNTALSETNFWLVIDALPTRIVYGQDDFVAEFTGGSITLPPDLFTTNAAPNPGPVTVGITGRLCVRYDFVQRRLEFCGPPDQPFIAALQKLNLHLPELPGFSLAIHSAALELSGTQFPRLKNLNATLTLPLPGADAANPAQNRSAVLDLNAQNWRLDGLPEAASVTLGADVNLVNAGGFAMDFLAGSGLAMTPSGGAGSRVIRFTLTGNLRAGFSEQVLTEDATGTAARFGAGGSLAWDMRSLPVFVLNAVQFEGNFRLGEDGPRITGLQSGGLARITFTGLENLFQQSSNRPFVMSLEGALEVPDVIKFGLLDTKFILDGAGLRFQPGGVQAELGNQSLDLVQEALPVYLSKAGLTFKNAALPLVPGPGQTGLFDLTNLIITISGGVNLPNKVALDAGAPGFAGEVNDIAMSLQRDAQNHLLPEFSLNGLGVALRNVDIPPLGALTGGLYVGNLNDPDNLYFAGTVAGTVNDIGAGITMAVHRQKGLLGACFELDVGPAGIPLDGGALGGILLTGGKGGLSFGNRFADPCDFRSYIQFTSVNGTNQPANDGSTDSFDPTGPPSPPALPPTPSPAAPGPNSCVVGDFPPATINPLCEPHPSIANRIIFKGTALSAAQLTELGFTAATCPRTLRAAVAFAAGKISQPLRNLIGALTNSVPPTVPAETKGYYADLLLRQLRQLENTASSILSTTLGEALALNPNASLYDAIVAAAGEGIPCLDATLKLQGNFSHAAVSTVLKGEGAVVVSTTGTALMQGAIKLIGIPIGEGTLAFSLTDSQGHVNPSFGGVVNAGVGPLTLGEMSLAYQCDGCFDAVIHGFGAFLQANAQNLGADARTLLITVMNRSVPLAQPRPVNGDPAAFYQALKPRQQLGFVVSLFNLTDLAAAGGSLPGIPRATALGFLGSFRQFVTDVATQVNPRFCFQAKAKPALFGFPLIPGPTPLDARFAYERVTDEATGDEYQQLSANAVFSPAFIMGTLTTGTLAFLNPGSDQANFGFSFRTPAFTPERVEMALGNPAQFAADQFRTLLEDSVMTFGYAFMPLGIPLAEGQARVVLPRLENHPTNPNRAGGAWHLPAGNGIASREDVIIAALVRHRLMDPNWRGQRGELDDLFAPFNPAPAPQTAEGRLAALAATIDLPAMAQYSLAGDYFPHGGIIGASRLDLPSVLAEAPPFELFGRVFDVTNPNWVTDAQSLFNNYLTANTAIGQMAVYLPAPNPPFGFDFSTNTADALLKAVSRADVLSIIKKTAPGGVYPFDQVLLAGWMRAQLLGLPLGDGVVRYTNGHFKTRMAVAQGTWLSDFIGASADVEIRPPAILNPSTPTGASVDEMYGGVTKQSIQEMFAARGAQISGNPTASFISNTVDLIERTLPKASVEMAANVQIPPTLQPILRAQAGANLSFFAFSPAFDPAFGRNGPGSADDDNSPYAVARRRGGLGLKGAFDFGLNLQDGDPNNDLRFRINDASFSLTPDAQLGVFPALNGQLAAGDINLPFMPRLRDGRLTFSSSPDNLAAYISVAGRIDPFDILIPNPFGQSIPIAQFKARGGPGAVIGGTLTVFKDTAVPLVGAGARLEIEPMRVTMPLLGPDVAMTIYGSQNGGVLTPFRFTSSPGDRWAATVKLHAASDENRPPIFGICDPRTVTQDGQGNWGGDPASCAMSFRLNAPIFGSMEGIGFDSLRLAVVLPRLTNVTFFPNSAMQTVVSVIGAGTNSGLIMIEKTPGDGLPRFYVDFGQVKDLGLPGVLTASGRFEFGYNPTNVPGSIVAGPATLSFGALEICSPNPVVRSVTVTNRSSEPANVLVRVSDPTNYTVAAGQFALSRNGGFRTVDVLFHPRTTGTRTATLFIEGDNAPTLNVPLTGSGTATPRYFQSRDTIEFGDTVAGQVAAGTVLVANEGCGTLTVSSVAIAGAQAAAFTVTPAGSTSLGPGQSRLYRVEFAPTAVPIPPATGVAHSATLTIATSITNRTVALTGNATESRWVTVMDADTAGSTAAFNSLLMLDGRSGWAVGDGGTVYETRDGGRSWRSRILTPFNLNSIAAEARVSTPVVAIYHFEEPPEALQFRDDGPGGFHARAETDAATAAPTNSLTNGRLGSGLGFDGVNDAAYIAGALVLSANSSVALWANPSSATASDVLVAQTDPTANTTLFTLETAGSAGYRVRLGSQTFAGGGAVTAGWQHLAATLAFNAISNLTTVRFYKNGSQLWTTNFTGTVPTAGSRIWGLGARYQSLSSRTSFFSGAMDELAFYGGTLSAAEIATLASGDGGLRLLMAGDEGTLLQSETLGRSWHKVFDLNPDGWRQRDGVYYDYDWKDVLVGGSADKVVVGGTRRTTSGVVVNYGVIMVEDLYPGLPLVQGDERYDEVPFTGSTVNGVDVQFNALVGTPSGSKVYGFTHGGRVYQSASGNLTNDWSQHGTLDVNVPLHDASMVGTSSYLAVGDNGTVVRSASGANPTVVSNVAALTARHLRGLSWIGSTASTVPEVHVVGDGGVYLTSTDLGVNNWALVTDGLTGNNRAVVARESAGGYEAWVAGEEHRIQYRTAQPLANAFLTFHPGELDFGMLTVGGSRTLPLEIRNRGRRDLILNSLSVSGTGFTLVQGGISRVAPGDAMVVQVRFRPTNEIAYAQGSLAIVAVEGGSAVPFNVPLVGRASGLEWQPVTVVSAGTPLSGSVIDLAFTTDTTGYALLPGAVMKTTDGGLTWNDVSPDSGSVLITLSFRSLEARRVGGVDVLYLAGSSFSRSGFPPTRGAVWRSGDGGTTWAGRTPPVAALSAHPPFGDISVLHDDANVVVCVTSDPTGLDADVWQSTDAGVTWTKKARPPDQVSTSSSTNASFAGGRVIVEEIVNGVVPASDGWTVVATEGAAIYSRAFNGEWPYVTVFPSTTGEEALQFDPLLTIRALQFGRDSLNALNSGWLVGAQGLYWRWVPVPPNRSPFAGTESEWRPAANQEVFGRTDLEAISMVRYTNGPALKYAGWIVGGSKIFGSRDGGASWALDYDAGEGHVLRSVITRSPTNAWAGGSLAGRATVWRYRPGAVPARGILSVNDVELFTGTITPGTTNQLRTITVQNLGNAALRLQHIGLESEDAIARFRLVGNAPTTLAAGGSTSIQVAFDASPDPVNVEALAPVFFHRFEQGFTDTTFFDAASQHADIRLDGAGLVPTNARPRIRFDARRRDRSLEFDGDDYAEVPGNSGFTGDFSVAFWVNPTTTADGQMFVTSHGTTGGNRLLIGFLNGGYHVRVLGLGFAGGDKRAGWQHLAVTGARTPTNSTLVTVYRDGEILWQQSLGAVLNFANTLPWLLGAERDSPTDINEFLTGQLDDVAVFDRLLTESEIPALAAKSPVCGDHVARLVFQTDSESGERTTELRATVQEVAGAVVIETIPPGASVQVDGVAYPTPVTFAVGCTAATPKEWLEGSQHTIVAPSAVALVANANTLTYGFSDWSLQNAAGTKLEIVARPNLGRVTARYRLETIASPGGGGAGLAAASAGDPLFQAAGLPPDLNSLVAGTPAGPWFRLSGGRLDIPSLGANGFTISGELFASLSRMKGSLTSTAINWPGSGSRFLQLGPGEWQLDAVAGSHFRMRTRPPSLTLLGNGVAPDGEFRLDFDLDASRYTASFDLRQDFRPAPNFFEIARNAAGRAGVSMTVGLPDGQSPAFTMTVDGRVRALRLPAGLTGQGTSGWAVEQDVAFALATADFNLSLRDQVVGAAAWPSTLFNGGVFTLGAGDVRIARANNGPILLILTNLSLALNGQTAATVSGSVGTDTTLNLNGTVAGGTDLRLLSGTRFVLRSRDGGPMGFGLGLRALPSPRFQLNLPAARLRCTPGANVDPLEVDVPAIDFDTAGIFDTGKLPLPGAIVFDGISVFKPSDARLDKNYLRLKRDATGKVVFKLRAQQLFEAPGISCRNDLKVTIDNGLSASFRGNFCVLPEPISLGFNGADACQFSGSLAGQTIFFGSGCAGVRNDATGACLGTCP